MYAIPTKKLATKEIVIKRNVLFLFFMSLFMAFNVAVRGRAVQTNTLIDGKKGCQMPDNKKGEKIARSLLTAWLSVFNFPKAALVYDTKHFELIL